MQKLRENHETIQQLTFQLQQMLEQMNSMSDSGDSQDVESNFSGKVVSRFQSTCDDSEFSFLAQPRQKIAAWRTESIWITGKRFWTSIFYVWFTQRLFSKNSIWRRAKKSWSSPWSRKDEDQSNKWRQTKSWHNSNADICNKAVDYEFYNTGGIAAELCGRTAKTANIGTAIRQIPQSTIALGEENSFQNLCHYLFWFSIEWYVVDQRSGDGWFFGRVTLLAISIWKEFSKLRDAGRENCIFSEQDHLEFLLQERSVWRNRKFWKRIGSFAEDRSPSWSTTTFESLVLMTVFDYADLFSVTLHEDNIQEFDTRWDEEEQVETKR